MSVRAIVLAIVGAALMPMAFAQDEAPAPSRAAAAVSEPASTDDTDDSGLGGRFHGATELLAEYTDNFFRQPNDRPRRSATGFILKPGINYISAAPRFRFHGGIGGAFGIYTLPGNADDYRDLHGTAGVNWLIADRHALAYNAVVRKGHDPFGTDRTANTPLENRSLDRWDQENYNLLYKYGTPRGAFDIETRGFAIKKAYRTNRDESPTTGTRFLDYDTEGGQATLFYNYSPKTKGILDFYGAHHDYVENPGRGGNEYRIRGGIRWLATAKTSGDARIGYVTRDFRSPTRPTFHGLDWLVSAAWSPTSYRLFVLKTGRASVPSYNTAGFIDFKHANLEWREEWAQRFNTRLGVGYQDSRFVGTPRDDRGYTASVRAEYLVVRSVVLFGAYDYFRRNSNDDPFDYDKNTASLGVRVSY